MSTNEFWKGTGQAHEFAQAWRKVGGTEADVSALIQKLEKLGMVVEFARGNAEIVVVRRVLTIDRTTSFNATKFIGEGWSTWRGPKKGDGLSGKLERDAHSLILSEIDITKIQLKNYLAKGQTSISGEDRLKASMASGDIAYDAKVGQALYEEEGQKSLRWLYDNRKVTWMEFAGETLRNSDGRRCFLCLCWRGDGSWDWGYNRLGRDRDASYSAAVLGK